MTITRSAIAAVHRRIAPFVRKTPVLDIAMPGVAQPVTLKLEYLQLTGSFKARGAFATLTGEPLPPAGVAAASGGNHGIAVACAAQALGVPAHIFVPAIATPAKIDRIRSYGANVTVGGAAYAEAAAACDAFIAESGALGVHAYDALPTVLGQGTVAAELEEQANDLDTILVATGGGGLIAGIASWYGGSHQVVAVEPETCATASAALLHGGPVDIVPSGVAADSLGASRLGEIAYEALAKAQALSVLVTDNEIRAAQGWLWNNARIVSEPGGATAFAALLSGRYAPEANERVAAIVCGANVDPATFATVL
ncbi:MAG: threonine/serine dehydratase [Hyphomicrobiales bacterium]